MDMKKILSELTIEEKASLLVGKDAWNTMDIERLDIPSIVMADGPHGLRKVIDGGSIEEVAEKAVCYPSLVTLASSFDPDLAYHMGDLIAKEFKSKGVHIILGPGVNIKRHPFCGRNFEYFSEDPLVTSKLATAYVKGAKSNDIGVAVKHYALNSQESYRMSSNSLVDTRAKYEIYYKSFKDLVELDPEMVMCSYNKVDGTYASENIDLLKKTLRDEFGFKNVIVSDWTAVNDRTLALMATLDLEMPGYIYGVHTLIKDFKSGKIPLNLLDESVERILLLAEKFRNQETIQVDLEKHHLESAQIAAESMVLLKNDDHILPVKEDEKVLLIGEMAEKIRYQGGGSSHINLFRIDSIFDCLIKHDHVDYHRGYDADKDEINQELAKEILETAKNYDKIVFVGGLTDKYESEGYDREHLSMPQNQEYLINALVKVNPNVIVVLELGSPILMPYHDQVKGILNCYLGGEAMGLAVEKILFGEINPSGRLAETFPLNEMDIPSHQEFAKGNNNVFYKESIYVGYRYYQSLKKPVLFPFGFGMSYSHFEYSNIRTSKKTLKNGNESLKVSVDITNNGPFDGKEVVLLFSEAKKPRTPRPKRELIDFTKVFIKNGVTKSVTFTVNLESFRYYHSKKKAFVTDDGIYHLQFMKNARDILVEIPVEVLTGKEYLGSLWNTLDSYQIKGGLTFKDEDFAKLIGTEIKDRHVIYTRPYSINNNIEDIEHTFIGKILKKNIDKQLAKQLANQTDDFKEMVLKSIYQMPLRFIAKFSHGQVSINLLEALIALINRQYFKALKHFFRKD